MHQIYFCWKNKKINEIQKRYKNENISQGGQEYVQMRLLMELQKLNGMKTSSKVGRNM